MDIFELGRAACGVLMLLAVLGAGVFCLYGYGRWWA